MLNSQQQIQSSSTVYTQTIYTKKPPKQNKIKNEFKKIASCYSEARSQQEQISFLSISLATWQIISANQMDVIWTQWTRLLPSLHLNDRKTLKQMLKWVCPLFSSFLNHIWIHYKAHRCRLWGCLSLALKYMINNKEIQGKHFKTLLKNQWQVYNVQDYNLNPILLCNLDSFFSCFGVPALILLMVHNTKQDTLTFISGSKS